MRAIAILGVAACGTGLHTSSADEVVATGLDQAANVAIVGDTAYVVLQATGGYRVMRVPTAGGAPEAVSTSPVITGMVGDASGVYWLALDGGVPTLKGIPAGGSAPMTLGTTTSGFNGLTLRNLTTDATNVYWADETAAVWRAAKAGGGATQLGTTDTTAGAVAVDGTGVWVGTLAGAKRVAGGETAAFSALPSALVWDGGSLVALDAGSGAADGNLQRAGTGVIADGLTEPVDLAVDDAFYLATENDDHAVRRIELDGSDDTVLAIGDRPAGIALDAGYVYWTEPHLGELHRVAR